MTSALVLGDANTVWADAEAALSLFEPDIVIACNNIGREWKGRVDHWCTLHPAGCKKDWKPVRYEFEARQKAGRNRPVIWAHKNFQDFVDNAVSDWGGSTGLFAVKVARVHLGVDRIVLAGIPMSSEGAHYYTDRAWVQAHLYYKGWKNHLDEIAPYVRSMSGWTRELLGAPTQAWLTSAAREDERCS